MKKKLSGQYNLWCEKAVRDPDLKAELASMAGNETLIEEAFYKDLEFGTAGLRGILGAGTNRMNVYTVARASKAMAEYVLKFGSGERSIAVAYDSR
ncbi:MAG: phospho-sugar mutase, partial [Lachnospiraceae bacterium]|nr:phospho-sugar mutase [Lachnospiraceae bacterium]